MIIANLSSSFTATILSTFRKPRIKVGSDNPIVQFRSSQISLSSAGMVMLVILNEAKSARMLGHFVQTHYYPLHWSTSREEFKNLLLSSEKSKISNVQSGAQSKFFDNFLPLFIWTP